MRISPKPGTAAGASSDRLRVKRAEIDRRLRDRGITSFEEAMAAAKAKDADPASVLMESLAAADRAREDRARRTNRSGYDSWFSGFFDDQARGLATRMMESAGGRSKTGTAESRVDPYFEFDAFDPLTGPFLAKIHARIAKALSAK